MIKIKDLMNFIKNDMYVEFNTTLEELLYKDIKIEHAVIFLKELKLKNLDLFELKEYIITLTEDKIIKNNIIDNLV